jgi:hypothetical protein
MSRANCSSVVAFRNQTATFGTCQQHVLAHPRHIADRVPEVKDALPLSFNKSISGLHWRADWVQEAIMEEGSPACWNVHRLLKLKEQRLQ